MRGYTGWRILWYRKITMHRMEGALIVTEHIKISLSDAIRYLWKKHRQGWVYVELDERGKLSFTPTRCLTR